MSEDHSHKHGHPHHDHDHDHGHDPHPDPHPDPLPGGEGRKSGADSGHIELKERAAATPPPPSPAPAVQDFESEALSEALRSSFVIVKAIMLILVIVFFASGVFTVPSQEKAIILRFGKPVGTGEKQLLEPGLHWSFPYPIDEVVRIPIGQIQTVLSTAGWYATTPEAEATNTEPAPMETLNPASDGYTLTSDGNIIHVRATLRYRISDPLKYALRFVNITNILHDVLDNALFHASAQFTVDQALRSDVLGFQEKVLSRVRQLVEEHGVGITLEPSEVRTIPPRQVKQAFEEVLAAELDRRKIISDAQGQANRVVSTAAGEAASVLNSGKTDQARRMQALTSQAQYFLDQLPHFEKNPELFLARLQTETIHQILTNLDEQAFLPIKRDGNREVRLQLSREPPPVQTRNAAGSR